MRTEHRFDPVSRTVAEARHFVRSALAECSLPSDEAALLVSELATNAVLHARTPYTVAVTVMEPEGARVAVTDDDPTPPLANLAGSDQALGGRGMALVVRLSRRWGCEQTQQGKTVWFEI